MAATSRQARLLRRPPCLLDRSAQDGAHADVTGLPAEVCERMRRDGGSVFPALANTGDPNGPLRPVR